MSTRPQAILETSFWVAACRAEAAANCLDFFDLVVPIEVEAEIRAPQPDFPSREYLYTTLFRQLRDKMRDPPEDAPPPLRVLGKGEAAAIPLAQSLSAVLLINEYRGAEYAKNLGLQVVTVPSFIVALRNFDLISDRAARRKLELIAPITAPAYIREAQQLLDALR